MAYRNGVKIVETTKTRREANPPVWVHISKMPGLPGITYKKAKPLPLPEREVL